MTDGSPLRWDTYFMARDAGFDEFWRQFLDCSERRLLYILGNGSDPRMCLGVEHVLEAGAAGRLHVMLLTCDEGSSSLSQEHNRGVEINVEGLRSLLDGRATLETRSISMWAHDGTSRRRTSSVESARLISSSQLDEYTDVVIDIGALPRSVYLSLIGRLMYLSREHRTTGRLNLHVIVAEDSSLDRDIIAVGIDENADYVYGFGGGLDLESSGETPTVFMPILGEGQRDQLIAIYGRVTPEEICPILPFPSRDPRRGDNLIVEYRELLFDQWRIEPRNIIYASELNPFDAYRQICRAALRYDQVLQPLGGCKIALAALSSKLISLGALLSAYDLHCRGLCVGLADVEAEGYILPEKGGRYSPSLFSLWLVGECYV